MKKVALLLLNQKDHVRRGAAFIKNTPNHEFTFVFLSEQWEIDNKHPFIVSFPIPVGANIVVGEKGFDPAAYDLVLPMADKVCDFFFDKVYPSLVNANNKRTLQKKIDEFGKFDFIKSSTNSFISEFSDDESVIVKPAISSGGFSLENFCYSLQKFKDVKHLYYDSNYIIQEYLATDQVPYLIMINNSEDLVLIDIYDQEWAPSVSGNFFSPFMETRPDLEEKFKKLLVLINEFFTFLGFKEYRGFFGLQFLAFKNRFIPIDCNLRTSPVSLEIEHNNLAHIMTYKVVPFLLKEQPVDAFKTDIRNNDQVRSYVEINGVKVTKREFTPDIENRVCIRSDKTSGVFRSEYEVFIEKVNHNE